MRGPRPSMGRVNRGYDSNGPRSFGYGRSGTLNEGQNYYNSYINMVAKIFFNFNSVQKIFEPNTLSQTCKYFSPQSHKDAARHGIIG